ncbi:MAG: hypothetical protein AAB557_00780 [Patescibacteria group bacterium]
MRIKSTSKELHEEPQKKPEPTPSPPLSQKLLKNSKLKWFGLGLVLLIGIFLLVDYIRKDVLRPPVLFGSVLHENSDPFDGAIVSANGKLAMTRPDGKFQIQAKQTDTLTISAIGYSPTTILGKEIVATLTKLPTANARVMVVDGEYNVVEKALVIRLDPNTSAPVDERITNKEGSVTFSDILSGQAAFVVLHPDYGMAWIESAVESGGYTRPVIQLTPLQGDKIGKNGFFKTAYAKAEYPLQPESTGYELREELIYQFSDVSKIANEKLLVSLKTQTMVAVSFSRKTLADLINRRLEIERQFQSEGRGDYTYEEGNRIRQILLEQGYITPVTAIRIVPTFTDTSFEMESAIRYGYDPKTGAPLYTAASVNKITQNQYEVEILGMDNASEVMGFIERMRAQTPGGGITSVTGWSQFPTTDFIKQNGGRVSMEFNFSNNCCTLTNLEISSNTTQANQITVKDLRNKENSYTYKPSRGETSALQPDVTDFEKFMQSNPRLEITNPYGQKVSLFDIETPVPNEAPPGFLGDFFEDSNEARKMFMNGDPNYFKKWRDYLGMKVFDAVRQGKSSPMDIRNEIIRKLGLPPRYFEPLGFPTGSGSNYRTGSSITGDDGNSFDNPYSDEAPATNTDSGSGDSSTGNEQTGSGASSNSGSTTGSSENTGCPEGATFTCSR